MGTALRGRDRRVRRGAARLWTKCDSPLAVWHPVDEASLRAAVLDVMMEARYEPLRERAADLAVSWAGRIGHEGVERRLRRLLRDPSGPVRRRSLVAAGRSRVASLEDDLLAVLAGGRPDVTPLPPVPPEEEEDVPSGADDVVGPVSDAEVAALALGYLGSERARAPLARLAQETDSRLARIALALLGEGLLLRASDFLAGEESVHDALPQAALAAVARLRGRHGLPRLLEAARSADRLSEEKLVEGAKTILLENDAPGRGQIEAARRAEDLQAWYALHGPDYERRVSPAPPDGVPPVP